MKIKMFYGASPLIFQRAKELRNQVTHGEMVLWDYLRNNQIGYRFRRQHPIGNFIVDFYCHQLKLVIEIDGSIHNEKDIQESDKVRQKILEADGLTILRFTNDEVLRNIGDVIQKINALANAKD